MLFVVLISNVIKAEYDIWGITLILFIHSFYPFKDVISFLGKNIKTTPLINKVAFLIGFSVFAILKYIDLWGKIKQIDFIVYTLCTILPGIIMLLNNGKKGPSLKYFFYIFYPLQFVILTLLYNWKVL